MARNTPITNQEFSDMNRKLALASIVLLCAGLQLACTHQIQVYEYKSDFLLDHVFVKKGADFSRYQSIIFDEVSVWYPKDDRPSPEKIASVRANLAMTQEIFYSTLSSALADRYTIRTKPAKNTLRLEVQFIDLRALAPGSPVPADLARYVFRTQPGHITMVARLFDAKTGDLLARVADLGKRASAGGEAVVDWEAIASDIDYWARVFRAWLDQ
jgi:hypothetical protein